MQLKYLFTAEYKDGSIYQQNKEDKSIFTPNGSCMSDIQKDIDTLKIKRFTLKEQSIILPSSVSVDLTDGHFEVNGVSFQAEGDRPLPTPYMPFKLVYFRIRRDSYSTPAVYLHPQSITKNNDGSFTVINSRGEKHYYPKVKKTWKQLDDVTLNGKTEKVERTYIQPEPPLPTVQYMLGWQATLNGKNYQQVIIV